MDTPADMLQALLETQSVSGGEHRMVDFVVRSAAETGATIEIHQGNVYAVRGQADLYPCVVAHTDTVHQVLDDDCYKVILADGE